MDNPFRNRLARLTLLALMLMLLYFLFKGGFFRDFVSVQAPKTYDQYLKGPQQELFKLLQVLDQFKNTGFKVIYEGHEYDINLALIKAKQFIGTHYHNEKADQWVKVNLYRSQSKGEIIYLKYPDGKLRPLRDVIVEELHSFSI